MASGSSPPSALLCELTPPDRPAPVCPRGPQASEPRQPDLRGALPGAMGHTLVLLFPITRFLSCRFLSSFHLASWVSESCEVERWCVPVVRCRLGPFLSSAFGKVISVPKLV